MKRIFLAVMLLPLSAFTAPAFAGQGSPVEVAYSSQPQPHQFAPSWGRRDGRVN